MPEKKVIPGATKNMNKNVVFSGQAFDDRP